MPFLPNKTRRRLGEDSNKARTVFVVRYRFILRLDKDNRHFLAQLLSQIHFSRYEKNVKIIIIKTQKNIFTLKLALYYFYYQQNPFIV